MKLDKNDPAAAPQKKPKHGADKETFFDDALKQGFNLAMQEELPLPEVKCYYCRETIRLTRQSPKLVTADHICMSETAKAKRFPQLDEELQKLRAQVDNQQQRRFDYREVPTCMCLTAHDPANEDCPLYGIGTKL